MKLFSSLLLIAMPIVFFTGCTPKLRVETMAKSVKATACGLKASGIDNGKYTFEFAITYSAKTKANADVVAFVAVEGEASASTTSKVVVELSQKQVDELCSSESSGDSSGLGGFRLFINTETGDLIKEKLPPQ